MCRNDDGVEHGLKLTKASMMELRSLSPVFDGLLTESEVGESRMNQVTAQTHRADRLSRGSGARLTSSWRLGYQLRFLPSSSRWAYSRWSVSAVVATILAVALQSPARAGEGALEFNQLEDVWNQAHLQGDADALDRLMADDIVVIVPKMPAFTKSEALSVFRAGRMKFARYESSEIKVRTYEGCVVVTGALKRSRSMGERVLNDDWRFTKVYVREPKGWRVVTFHASETGQ